MVLRGEGEYTFKKAIECLGTGKKVITQDENLLNLDELPIPAREFLDRDFLL